MLSRWANRSLLHHTQPRRSTLRRAILPRVDASPFERLRRYSPLQYQPARRPALDTIHRSANHAKSFQSQHRTFVTSSIPPVLPPCVFIGLLLALWTWKCAMMVLFQDKIIYMPSMPPYARREKVEDYTDERGVCNGVRWKEERIRSADGVRLSLLVGKTVERSEDGVGSIQTRVEKTREDMQDSQPSRKEVFILYFQGNGSSLPPRLPILSAVLASVHTCTKALDSSPATNYTLLALSYRGYWTSTGRATQSGIEMDAQAALKYITSSLCKSKIDNEVILWGQSIGAGVATAAAATYLTRQNSNEAKRELPRITGLVLETPFTSVKNMLTNLYPQKWLPYRYLHPFLWNRWDSDDALRRIASSPNGSKPRVLLLPAGRDEVVPAGDAEKLERLCQEIGLDVERKEVVGALHHEASLRRDGQAAIAKFVTDGALRSKL